MAILSKRSRCAALVASHLLLNLACGSTDSTPSMTSDGPMNGGSSSLGGTTSAAGGSGGTSTAMAGSAGADPSTAGDGGTGGQSDVLSVDLAPPVYQEPCPANAPEPEPGERPNFLWIVSEDNSPMLGAYGDELADTPNLDQLAAEGIRYDNAFAPTPVCSSTRLTIFWGIHNAAAGGAQDHRSKRNNQLPSNVRPLAELLRDSGYYTTNNSKTDYAAQVEGGHHAWNESSNSAHWSNRPGGTPFFAIFNSSTTHESRLHGNFDVLTSPGDIALPPYHPDHPAVRKDWARNYDQMTRMDAEFGARIQELKDAGVYDNTIIFYYGDHGGVVAGSKRWVYDRGTRVPLIVRVPPKWCHVMPGPAGSSTDQMVSLMDTMPTVLHVAGVDLPDYLDGKPFLGAEAETAHRSLLLGRRRMDESLDLVRAVRTKDWLYVMNFYPQRPAASRNNYGYQAAAFPAWEQLFKDGKLNDIQSQDWLPRPGVQLYNVHEDPYQVNNLIDDPTLAPIATELRALLREHMLDVGDTGFSPEAISNPVTYATRNNTQRYPMERLIDLGFAVADQDPANIDLFVEGLSDENPSVRYWSASGLIALGEAAAEAQNALQTVAQGDADPLVRIAAGEALVALGAVNQGRSVLEAQLIANKNDRVLPLFAGQAYVTWPEALSATPDSVFSEVIAANNDGDVDDRMRYLRDR